MENQITTTEKTTEKTVETIPVELSSVKHPLVIIPPDQHNPMIRKRNSLGYYLTLGIRGLLGSKKGSFSILVLLITTIALFTSKISGMEFCSAITIVAGIYAAGATATDIQNMRSQ